MKDLNDLGVYIMDEGDKAFKENVVLEKFSSLYFEQFISGLIKIAKQIHEMDIKEQKKLPRNKVEDSI